MHFLTYFSTSPFNWVFPHKLAKSIPSSGTFEMWVTFSKPCLYITTELLKNVAGYYADADGSAQTVTARKKPWSVEWSQAVSAVLYGVYSGPNSRALLDALLPLLSQLNPYKYGLWFMCWSAGGAPYLPLPASHMTKRFSTFKYETSIQLESFRWYKPEIED